MPSQRESALQSGEVDVVVRTYSITCERKQVVDFSTVYFVANQRILARKGSGIDSAAALAGKRVCAVSGTTSLSVLLALQPGPTLFGAATWTDCLVMLQQGQVDAISTDDAVLFGLRKQDPTLESSVPAWASSPTASESRRRTKTWSDSSTASSNKCDPTEPGSASMRDGCRTSAPARSARSALPGLMPMLTTTEIDRELDSRTKEVAAMSSTLVELDSHPGLEHVRRYTPTGVTAQRWAVVESALAQLWQDLARMTSILESAQTVRGRRSKLDDDDRAELTKLLRERSLEVARQPIPLSQREIGAPDELVEYAGLVDTANRMRDTYPAVVEFLDAVDEIDTLIARGLAPLQKKLDEAREPGPTEIAGLLTVSAVDPLSLTVQDVDQRITAIARDVNRRAAELAELAALQANWPEEVAATARGLDELRDSRTACGTGPRLRRAEGRRRCASRAPPTSNRTCAQRLGRSPRRIPPPCDRCGTRSRRHCSSYARTKHSGRACSTVATN